MSLQELKQALKSRTEPFAGRYVTIFLQSELMTLTGSWYWDMHTDAVFCSDVMVTLPVDFAGIKSMIHPEDVEHVRKAWLILITIHFHSAL